ncbi:2,3-diaminopropionate biosynthesis protein SbnB [Paenibacillus sp. IB182496]|uniref:2,3-diaminopropionate biosynthesis protein SbnB n=1 Tax=Paenibacillus sabuli TaxID=2772509 RepID=A0A927GUS5_9BACL|nr:2,3-diaminopropionate biosynthesis protein SbnB [Paenibacillus sabuli]MBD2848475.1 2,3-diaminopropionate biosynthesis protein SbnB [Paenibacillus sabuli]
MTTMLYLNREDIRRAGGESAGLYVEAVSEALALHAQGAFVQPLKPYLRAAGKDGHIADRIIAMPAHLGGAAPVSGIKWIGSKHDNPAARGLERASGVIVLNDPQSNYPIAILEAGLISGMRTAAVTVVGARHLARRGFRSVGCIGCGAIARMQLQALLEHFPAIAEVHLHDLDGARAAELAAALGARYPGVRFGAETTAEAAVRAGEVVVTATVADRPYIPYEWLRRGAFVSNISIMDLHKDVFLCADKIVVDDWEQANREKKVLHQLVTEGRFTRERLHAELGEIVCGRRPGRERADEIVVLNPMGMAIEDIACAHAIYERARAAGLGQPLELLGALEAAAGGHS